MAQHRGVGGSLFNGGGGGAPAYEVPTPPRGGFFRTQFLKMPTRSTDFAGWPLRSSCTKK